jgi:hypothetical protein
MPWLIALLHASNYFSFSEYAPLKLMRDKGGDGLAFMKAFLDAGYRVKNEKNIEYSREHLMNTTRFSNIHDVVFECNGQDLS